MDNHTNNNQQQQQNTTRTTVSPSLEGISHQTEQPRDPRYNPMHNDIAPKSPCPSPCRRSRDEMDDNDGFVTAKKSSKKQRQDSDPPDLTAARQVDSSSSPHHRYPTRLRRQQQSHATAQQVSHQVQNYTDNQSVQPAPYGINITTAATRFAITRFPFAPFIIRFSSHVLQEKLVAQDLTKHIELHHQLYVQISNVRKSNMKCQQHESDYLIYVKDAGSFSVLFNKQNWPPNIGGLSYTFPSMPSFPPQLSLVLKNVDLRVDVDDLAASLKSMHPEIHSVIRLRNKFQNEIRMIKLELLSIGTRLALLHDRKVRVNGMTYDVDEYLSPATVLICSNCRGIGHFKHQCTQVEETCNVCGSICPDLRQHTCSNEYKCIHCDGNHMSNSSRCPVIKDYRAALTKKLLSTNPPANNTSEDRRPYTYNHDHFPPLPPSQENRMPAHTNLMTKIDEIIIGMKTITESLERISKKQTEFEQFIQVKNHHDNFALKKIEQLFEKNTETMDVANNNERVIKNLILPTLELLSKFLYHKNLSNGGVDDADFKYQIQTKRVMIDKILSGKTDAI